MNRLADDYGHISNLDFDYNQNLNNIFELCGDLEKIKIGICSLSAILKNINPGMNTFDFLILINYVRKNNIKKVTELGCGSTSQLLDALGVTRTSFAMSRDGGNADLKFIECDILEKKSEICEDLLTSDLLLIDSWHSYNMAKFYHSNIMSYIKKPIFIHDIFKNGNTCYSEQKYWEEHIVNKTYTLKILSNLLNDLNPQERLPCCSAIFEPI